MCKAAVEKQDDEARNMEVVGGDRVLQQATKQKQLANIEKARKAMQKKSEERVQRRSFVLQA